MGKLSVWLSRGHAARTGIGSSRFRTIASAGISVALLAILTAVFYAAPATTQAQPPSATFTVGKNLCLGQPSDYTDPARCPLSPQVPVNQPVFYTITVANPFGQPAVNVTLSDTLPTNFTVTQTYCIDLSNNNSSVQLTGASPGVLGSFTLLADARVTCFVLGYFTQAGQYTNTVSVSGGGGTGSDLVNTDVLPNTPLNTDLEVTKTASPTAIDLSGGGVVAVDYTITIKNNGPAAYVDTGHWFVLHDNLRLPPLSVPIWAQIVPTSIQCQSSNTLNTDCLNLAGPTNVVTGQTLIGTMAPKPVFDWAFDPNIQGRIAVGETIKITFRVEYQKLSGLTCVKSLTQGGILNTAFFTLINANGTAASDKVNSNNTDAVNVGVTTGGTLDPNCADGQLSVTKVQVNPTGANSGMTPGSPLPWGTVVTYHVTIKNTSIPNQQITISGGDLEDYVVEGLGTPPFWRQFNGATCLPILSTPAALCTAYNAGLLGGGIPPSPPFNPPISFHYTGYYGQAALSYESRPSKAIPLQYGDQITLEISFIYDKPDCETVPNVPTRPIHNVALVKYTATPVGGGNPVQFTQTATTTTYMDQQKECPFQVTKRLVSGGPPVKFGTPLTYSVNFTNAGPARTIGTVTDVVRFTNPNYSSPLPFSSQWSCNASPPLSVGNVKFTGSITTGGAVYTTWPSQGAPAVDLRLNPAQPLSFAANSTLSCTIKITVTKPPYNNARCTADPTNFENLAFMEVTHPFNSNVFWPFSATYVASQSVNPYPAPNPPVNWASVQAPLPKCYDAVLNKEASIGGLAPAWTWAGFSAPPVDYAITVTNTSNTATSGNYLPLNWMGLVVADGVSAPYSTQVAAGSPVCTQNNLPSNWCATISPFGANPMFDSKSLIGVASLGASGSPTASGVWNLKVNPSFLNPPPPENGVIHNCARVLPSKPLIVSGEGYTNFDPGLAPPNPQNDCADVPVLQTTSIKVIKRFNDLTGANLQGQNFAINVSCQPYPLLSGSSTTLTVNAGGTATWVVNNVPVAANETCTVTETQPPIPAAAERACERQDGVPVWDPPSYSPAQPMNVTPPPPSMSVKITNTLRCKKRVDVSIEKAADPTMVGAGGYVAFKIAVRNNGASAITTPASIVVTDTLPTGFTYISWSASPWSCSVPSGQQVTCTYGGLPLAPSATTPTLQIIAKAEKEGTYRNCAVVTVDNAIMVGNGPTESCADVVVTPKEDCCCDTFLNGCFIDLSFLGDGYGCMTLAQMLWFMTITLLTAILWVAWCVCRLVKGMRQ